MKYVDLLLSMVFAVFVVKEWWGHGAWLTTPVIAFGRIVLSACMWRRSRWLLWYVLIYIFLVAYDGRSPMLFSSTCVVVPLVRIPDAVIQLFTGVPDTFSHDFLYTSYKDTGMLIVHIEYVWLLWIPLAYGLWLALCRHVHPSPEDFWNRRVAVFLCVSVLACWLYNEGKQYHQLSALWVWVLCLTFLPLASKIMVLIIKVDK